MFRVAIISCLLVVAFASPFTFNVDLNDDWQTFKGLYSKQYKLLGEEPVRRAIWESNLKYIEEHNREADRGVHTFWLGENEFADMTSEEFVKVMNGYKLNVTKKSPCTKYSPPSHVSLEDLPDTVDWRKEGYVTPVKNQGQCGSCWSFSTTGSLEGQHFKKTQKLVSLSEQNLMDCSKKEGNMGCQGGLMDNAFAYIIQNKGIDTEESYPYTAKNGKKCKFTMANLGATDVGCQDIPVGSEADLQSAVATVGPISVAIDAGHPSFQLYKRGVYTEKKCSSKRLDHGVLAVGYGTEGSDYWLVKNSWGAKWGIQGYIMMARNHQNMCGIATAASFPTV